MPSFSSCFLWKDFVLGVECPESHILSLSMTLLITKAVTSTQGVDLGIHTHTGVSALENVFLIVSSKVLFLGSKLGRHLGRLESSHLVVCW
jgi:hypothetical protein